MKNVVIYVVLVTSEGPPRILMLQPEWNARLPAIFWETPRGCIKPGESSKTAALRGLHTITGLTASDGKTLPCPFEVNSSTLGYFMIVREKFDVKLSVAHSNFHWAILEEVFNGKFSEKHGSIRESVNRGFTRLERDLRNIVAAAYI